METQREKETLVLAHLAVEFIEKNNLATAFMDELASRSQSLSDIYESIGEQSGIEYCWAALHRKPKSHPPAN